MNKLPIHKVHGSERRKLKKELSELKHYVKNFYYFHQLDIDMFSFYGGNISINDENGENKIDEINLKIKLLEEALNELSDE